MARKRSYVDACATAHALDLLGERWALLVVRELLLGPKRFTELRAGIPDVRPNMLSQRLRELEQTGVVVHRRLAPPAASQVYELTDWGYQLDEVVMALGRWGSRSPSHPRDGQLSNDSFMLALKTDFDPGQAEGLSASYELRLAEDTFHADVSDGRIEVGRGPAERPDATIDSDPGTLTALLWSGRELPEALRVEDIKIDGSTPAVERFLGLFPAPQPAAPAGSG
jgi:DNA-binding HxlR family transcriptional regulator